MPLLDFARREVALQIVGGPRLVCRPPTVRTVAVFLQRFGLQAAALCTAVDQGLSLKPEEALDHFLADLNRGDAVAVLKTCVDTGGVPLSGLVKQRHGLLKDLAEACLSLTDPARIIEATGLRKALDNQAGDAKADDGEDLDADAVCYVAAHFGVSPSDVLEWPYLAFLSAGEHMQRANKRAHEALEEQGGGRKYTPVPGIPMDGIIYEKGA